MEAVRGYDVNGYVEMRALQLARRHGVRHIVATQERDLERAAQLREILGLEGQRPHSAAAFRDKVEMKRLARDAGIPVAPHAEVECATDLIDFAGRFGFPLVLKPRNGGGSVDLRIIPGPEELDELLADETLAPDDAQPNLIAEAFVPGPMCHVDGLVVNGRMVVAWASQYLYALASYQTDRGGRRDVTLDPDDPLGRRLLAFTERVIQALPGPDAFAFHAEVFHTPEDELVLCEIACLAGRCLDSRHRPDAVRRRSRRIGGTRAGRAPASCRGDPGSRADGGSARDDEATRQDRQRSRTPAVSLGRALAPVRDARSGHAGGRLLG